MTAKQNKMVCEQLLPKQFLGYGQVHIPMSLVGLGKEETKTNNKTKKTTKTTVRDRSAAEPARRVRADRRQHLYFESLSEEKSSPPTFTFKILEKIRGRKSNRHSFQRRGTDAVTLIMLIAFLSRRIGNQRNDHPFTQKEEENAWVYCAHFTLLYIHTPLIIFRICYLICKCLTAFSSRTPFALFH